MKTNYPDIVDTTRITINDEKIGDDTFRYSLTIPLNNSRTKTLLVVMMNPSKATKEKSDTTINRVIQYINHNVLDYSTLHIVNLYPIYETYSHALQNYESLTDTNFNKIKMLLEESDDILLGWGKPKGKSQTELHSLKYHHNALALINICLNMKKKAYIIDSLRNGLYPRHLGRVSYKGKMNMLDINSLKRTLEERINKNSTQARQTES